MLSFWATTRTCTHVRNTRYPLVTWLPAQMSPKNSNYQQYTKWVAALRNAYWKAKKVLQLKRTVTMTANEKMMCICCTVGGDDGKNWSLKMYKEQSLEFYQFVCTTEANKSLLLLIRFLLRKTYILFGCFIQCVCACACACEKLYTVIGILWYYFHTSVLCSAVYDCLFLCRSVFVHFVVADHHSQLLFWLFSHLVCLDYELSQCYLIPTVD